MRDDKSAGDVVREGAKGARALVLKVLVPKVLNVLMVR